MMLKTLWIRLKQFRTWVFNIAAALIVVIPEILQGLAGHDWGGVLPARYMPYVTAVVIVVNVLMRPRLAAVREKEKAGE